MTLKFPHKYQLSNNNCGPASIQIVAKYYGKSFNQLFLAKTCKVNKEGCSIDDLCKGAESIGLKSGAYKVDIQMLKKQVKLPVIIHISTNHYVVLYKIKNDKYYVSDPQKGKYSLNEKEFSKLWIKNKLTGYVITVEPTILLREYEFNKANSLKALSFLLKYLGPYKKAIGKLVLVILFVVLIQAVLPFISKAVIDIGIMTINLDLISVLLVASIVLVISSTSANWIRDSLVLHLSNRIKISILSDFVHKLLKLPYPFFENRQIGDILQRIRDQERIQGFIMNFLFDVIISNLLLIVFGIILFYQGKRIKKY